MKIVDIAEFREISSLEKIPNAVIVIKSQDQQIRRKNMIANIKSGTIGRTTERPVAEGLILATDKLGTKNKIDFDSGKFHKFPEPRHIISYQDNFFLSTINAILLLDKEFHTIKKITNPYFAFLHTLSIDSERRKLLVVSSGYDAIFEIDLDSLEVSWEWFSWENGMEMNKEGSICTRDKKTAEKYKALGTPCLLVEPGKYSSYGVPTNLRASHPNAATYGEGTTKGKFIFSMGTKGHIVAVDLKSGRYEILYEGLQMMPHCIKRYGNGWVITNTLKGELCFFTDDFKLEKIALLKNLKGKTPEFNDLEWVQQVLPVNKDLFLALDANRGLIFFDLNKKIIFRQEINENWCVQDCIVL